jgi:hypothetical protein
MEGYAAKQEGKEAAKIAEQNAILYEQQAKAEEKASEYKADIHEEQAEELAATQRAKYGKAGVSLKGSPLTVLNKTWKNMEMDRLMILRQGSVKASQARGRAGVVRARGAAAERRGKNIFYGSLFSAGGTALTGTSKISDSLTP